MTDDRCPNHVQCRADHARGDMLCGFHHCQGWPHCIWYRQYQADEGIVTGNDAIDESISHEREEAT